MKTKQLTIYHFRGVGFDDRFRSQSLQRNLQFAVCSQKEAEPQVQCVQNQTVQKKKSRSKRRGIYCPIHGSYLDSVSKKYYLFADRPEELESRGMGRATSKMVIMAHTTVSIQGEWLEAFWCDFCQTTQWYHVSKTHSRVYELSLIPDELWQKVGGVIHPNGNPSVGEFTRKMAKMVGYQGLKAFNTIR